MHEVARVSAQDAEVLRVEFQLWPEMEGLDVMDFEVSRPAARFAAWVVPDELVSNSSPLRGARRAPEEVLCRFAEPAKHDSPSLPGWAGVASSCRLAQQMVNRRLCFMDDQVASERLHHHLVANLDR